MIQNLASKDSNQEKLILNDVSLASTILDVNTEMNFPSLNHLQDPVIHTDLEPNFGNG